MDSLLNWKPSVWKPRENVLLPQALYNSLSVCVATLLPGYLGSSTTKVARQQCMYRGGERSLSALHTPHWEYIQKRPLVARWEIVAPLSLMSNVSLFTVSNLLRFDVGTFLVSCKSCCVPIVKRFHAKGLVIVRPKMHRIIYISAWCRHFEKKFCLKHCAMDISLWWCLSYTFGYLSDFQVHHTLE